MKTQLPFDFGQGEMPITPEVDEVAGYIFDKRSPRFHKAKRIHRETPSHRESLLNCVVPSLKSAMLEIFPNIIIDNLEIQTSCPENQRVIILNCHPSIKKAILIKIIEISDEICIEEKKRREDIDFLMKQGIEKILSVKIIYFFSVLFRCSQETIRRDLKELESANK